MKQFFKKPDFGIFIFRLVAGGLMLTHGIEGLMKGPDNWNYLGQIMTQVGIHFGFTFWGMFAVAIQAIGGLCFILGLFFRPACALLVSVMAMAVFYHVQKGDSLIGAGGQSVLYTATFLAFLFIGAGSVSLQKDS